MNGPAGYPAGCYADPRAPWNAKEPVCKRCMDAPCRPGWNECDACGRGYVKPPPFAVLVVGPAGIERYLGIVDGRRVETDCDERATRYDLAGARAAADAYREECRGQRVYVGVVKIGDGEWRDSED